MASPTSPAAPAETAPGEPFDILPVQAAAHAEREAVDPIAAELLLEIGTEELPSTYVEAAGRDLARQVAERLERERLSFGRLTGYATPRRLAVHLSGLLRQQPDRLEEVLGPPAAVAFREMVPTQAAEGFARKQGVAMEELRVIATPRGDYVGFTRAEPGKPADRILPAVLAEAVLALTFPKSMRWGRGDLRFARPIRWVVCLLDHEILPVGIGRVRAARETRGHRFLAPAPLAIPHPAEYATRLRAAFVEPDPEERRRRLLERMRELAAAAGGRLVEDEELLGIVSEQVELPEVVMGSFDERFLQLPRPVLVTSLREHQRYFCLETGAEESAEPLLIARFLAVSNVPDGEAGKIRAGNERVLRARLEDAAFFFREDMRRPLAERVAELGAVLHLADIGSMADKARRLGALVQSLVAQLGPDVVETAVGAAAERAAELAKGDLVTHLVREFPGLQGVMGGEYARRGGEPPLVAEAIRDHYQPVGSDDPVPPSLAACLLGLADKLDNLACAFRLGAAPTGSADPYGLRRQAIGIIRIAWARCLHLDLAVHARRAVELLPAGDNPAALVEAIVEFARGRLSGLLTAAGHRYDAVAAIMALPPRDPYEARLRVEALSTFRDSREFEPLVTAFKRVSRILRQGDAAEELREDLLAAGAEEELYRWYREALPRLRATVAEHRYGEALAELARARPAVDAFFERVTVMDEDPRVRANRLRLMALIEEQFLAVADLRQVVT